MSSHLESTRYKLQEIERDKLSLMEERTHLEKVREKEGTDKEKEERKKVWMECQMLP